MPTENQKTVFKKVMKRVRKGEKVSISREMSPPYAKSMAKHPEKVTKSLGWKELMKKHLPDSKLSKVHDEGLKAKRDGKADHPTRHKYLDTAYKLKGKYAPEKVELEVDEKVDKDSKEYKEYILWRKKQ